MGGGHGNDKQYGGPGNDMIYAGRGRDESVGRGRQRHAVGARARGRARARTTRGDTLHGGNGNDTFKTRDGEADEIDCGPGIDTALLDFKDVIVDATPQNPNGSCEVVNRERAEEGRGPAESADPTEDVEPELSGRE